MNPIFDSEDMNSRMMQHLKPYLDKGIITSIEVNHRQNGPFEVYVKLIVPIGIQCKFDIPAIDQSKEAYERAMGVIK